MGDTGMVKQVYYIGLWQAQQVTEQLLRQISNQIGSKKKFLTNLQITPEGLGLTMLDGKGKVTRQDRVPLENVVDFIANKFITRCILAIARDKQQNFYKVYVFVCKSDRDAAELIHAFKATKKQLSGEGFNTNLTPKGKNWTLQQKGEVQVIKADEVPNGDVRVISTEKQNGGVVVIHSGERHDSLSRQSDKSYGSDVKGELTHLADEVRDIKRLLQGSKGRAQFEKHYGYKIIEMPITEDTPSQSVDILDTEVVQQPVIGKRETLYVKNSNYLRSEVPKAYTVSRMAGGGVARSTKRYKSNSHVITASNPQPQAVYVKRVYDSRNSALDQQYVRALSPPPRPVKYFSNSYRPILYPRARSQHALHHGPDIVHKNIEDVYKSRSLRRIYLPPTRSAAQIVEYVNSQAIDEQQRQQQQKRSENEIRHQYGAVVVSHDPEVRATYENTETDTAEESNLSNLSTRVNTSVNDNLDANHRQRESRAELKENKEKDNVIVVTADTADNRRSVKKLEEVHNVVYGNDQENGIKKEKENASNRDVSNRDVYYVKTQVLREDEDKSPNDENVVVIETERSKKFVRDDRIQQNSEYKKVHREVITELKSRRKEDEDNTGLFGAYVKKPDPDEPRDQVSIEKAYRYHDDERDDSQRKDSLENGEVAEGKRVRYNENIEHIPDRRSMTNKSATFEERHLPDVVIVEDADQNTDLLEKEFAFVNDEKERSDDEESYHLDTDALKAFTSDPDIVIIESDEKANKNQVREGSIKYEFTENEIHAITTRSEDTVLF